MHASYLSDIIQQSYISCLHQSLRSFNFTFGSILSYMTNEHRYSFVTFLKIAKDSYRED